MDFIVPVGARQKRVPAREEILYADYPLTRIQTPMSGWIETHPWKSATIGAGLAASEFYLPSMIGVLNGNVSSTDPIFRLTYTSALTTLWTIASFVAVWLFSARIRLDHALVAGIQRLHRPRADEILRTNEIRSARSKSLCLSLGLVVAIAYAIAAVVTRGDEAWWAQPDVHVFLLVVHVWLAVSASLGVGASALTSGRLLVDLYEVDGPPFRSQHPFLVRAISRHQTIGVVFVTFVFVYFYGWLALSYFGDFSQNIGLIVVWAVAGVVVASLVALLVIVAPTIEQRNAVEARRAALTRGTMRSAITTLDSGRPSWLPLRALATEAVVSDQLRTWYPRNLFFGVNFAIQALAIASFVATLQQSLK